MPTKIRFTIFLRDYGPVQRATDLPAAAWHQAVAEGRFATVYHGENDWLTPVLAVVRRHGYVNTLCKITFARPLPATVTEIIGWRHHAAARELCDGENHDDDGAALKRDRLAIAS